VTPPSLASRLRAMAEEFAAMPERPAAEVSLAASNRLRGIAQELEDSMRGETVEMCESECSPYIAKCGARFCSYEAMAHHDGVCMTRAVRQTLEKVSEALGVDGGASGDAPGMTTPATPKDDPSNLCEVCVTARWCAWAGGCLAEKLPPSEVSGWDVRGYQPHGWQPIESCTVLTQPGKDRQYVWVYGPDFGCQRGFVIDYGDGTRHVGAEGFQGDWEITHWMPLPPPPME